MKKILLFAIWCAFVSCKHPQDLPAERKQIPPESMLAPLIEETLRYADVQDIRPGTFEAFINEKQTEAAFGQLVPALAGWRSAAKKEEPDFKLCIGIPAENILYVAIVFEEWDCRIIYRKDSMGVYREIDRSKIME